MDFRAQGSRLFLHFGALTRAIALRISSISASLRPPVKTLLLMRHAKSSWRDAGLEDHERPLNGRGRRAAPYMGKLLAERGLTPDHILTSSALRAQDTARTVAQELAYAGPFEVTRRLYLADPKTYLAALADLPPSVQRPLIVGHNPGISELVFELTGTELDMPTAAVALIEVPTQDWSSFPERGAAKLAGYFRPPKEDKKSKG